MFKVPVGSTYYSVSEEVWYRSGPEDADRDFENLLDTLDLDEAIAKIRSYTGRNRLYLDLMTQTNETSAFGKVMFAGYVSQIDEEGSWRVAR